MAASSANQNQSPDLLAIQTRSLSDQDPHEIFKPALIPKLNAKRFYGYFSLTDWKDILLNHLHGDESLAGEDDSVPRVPRSSFKKIDLSGCDMVTDVVFHHLLQYKEFFHEVTDVLLCDCRYVTDAGIHWLLQLLDNGDKTTKRKIFLDGCPLISQFSSAALWNQNMEVHPLRVPAAFYDETATSSDSHHQEALLVIRPATESANGVLEYLFEKTPVKVGAGARFASNSEQQDFGTFRGLEIETSHPALDILTPPNPAQVLITFDLSGDPQVAKEHIATVVVDTACKHTLFQARNKSQDTDALPQVYCTQFIIIGLTTDSKEGALENMDVFHPVNILKEFRALEKINAVIDNFERQKNKLDFLGQQEYAHALRTQENLQFLLNSREHSYLTTLNIAQDNSARQDIWKKIIANLGKHFGMNAHVHSIYKEESLGLLNNRTEHIIPLQHVQAELSYSQFEEIFKFSHFQGLGLLCEFGEELVGVRDLQWLLSVFEELSNPTRKTEELQVPCVLPGTPYWLEADLQKILLEKASASETGALLTLLLGSGCLLQVPCLRVSPGDEKVVYILPRDLKGPPQPLPDFTDPAKALDHVVTVEKRWNIPMGCPAHLMQRILGECVLRQTPVMLWTDGLLQHHGSVEVLLQRENQPTGESFITVTCRMAAGLANEEKTRGITRYLTGYLWSVAHIYADIVDYCCQRAGTVVTSEQSQGAPANASICSSHEWDSGKFSVCTVCGGCSERGRSCDFYGIPGELMHQCPCDPETQCCFECGICKTCASALWRMRSRLRPSTAVADIFFEECEENSSNNNSDLHSDDDRDSKPDLLVRTPTFDFDPVILNDLTVTALGNYRTLRLSLFSDMERFHIFPGVPFAASFIDPQKASNGLILPEDHVVKNSRDSVTIRLRDTPAKSEIPESSQPHPLSEQGTQNFHVQAISLLSFNQATGEIRVWEDELQKSTQSYWGFIVGARPVDQIFKIPFDLDYRENETGPAIMIGVMSANFDFTNAQKYQEECLVIEVPKNDERERVRLEIRGKISPDDEKQSVKLELKGSQNSGSLILSRSLRKGPLFPVVMVPTSFRNALNLAPNPTWSLPQDYSWYADIPPALSAENHHQGDPDFADLEWRSIGEGVEISLGERILFDKETKNSTFYIKNTTEGDLGCKVQLTNPSLYHVKRNKFLIAAKTVEKVVPSTLVDVRKRISEDKFRFNIFDKPDDEDIEWKKSPPMYSLIVKCEWKDDTTPTALKRFPLRKLMMFQGTVGDPPIPSHLLEILVNGKLCHQVYIPKDIYKLEIVSSREDDIFISCPKAPGVLLPTDWVEGMYVEALVPSDRKVGNDEPEFPADGGVSYHTAVVTDTNDEGQICLTLSDLPNSSSWWTFPRAPEVLPLGYVHREKGTPHNFFSIREYRQWMKILKNGSLKTGPDGKASWRKHIPENLPPYAPEYLFLDRDADSELFWPLFWSGQANCTEMNLFTYQEAQIEVTVAKRTGYSNQSEDYYSFCPLPRNLNRTHLLYPQFSFLHDKSAMDIHILCTPLNDLSLTSAPHFWSLVPPDVQLTQADLAYLMYKDHYTLSTLHKMSVNPEFFLTRQQATMLFNDNEISQLFAERALQKLLGFYLRNTVILTNCLLLFGTLGIFKRRAQLVENFLSWHQRQISDVEGESSLKNVCDRFICSAHCISNQELWAEQPAFDTELFEPITNRLTQLTFDLKEQRALPAETFTAMPKLRLIRFTGGQFDKLPTGIGNCEHLGELIINKSSLKDVPTDINKCMGLTKLGISNTQLQSADFLTSLPPSIEELTLNANLLKNLSNELGKFDKLTHLDLSGNPLVSIPDEIGNLRELRVLRLCGVPWITDESAWHAGLTTEQFSDWLTEHPEVEKVLSKRVVVDLFRNFDKDRSGLLDESELAEFNSALFTFIPRLGNHLQDDTPSSAGKEILEGIFRLVKLTELHLEYQAFKYIPNSISKLTNLRILNLRYNPLLESLPSGLGNLGKLVSLRLHGCPSLRTPPTELVSRGLPSIKAYLRRLEGGFVENKSTKLMLVGLGGVGKTSLLKVLMSKKHQTKKSNNKDEVEEITDGIDIRTWKVKTSDDLEIVYSAWDFAGQSVYYNTHQFFLSKRAIYLLLWSSRQGHEYAGLDFWLSSIKCQAPHAPVFVVATHCDQVSKQGVPEKRLRKDYPQIHSFHFVSSTTGVGIADLQEKIIAATLDKKLCPYIGELIPDVWLKFKEGLLAERSTNQIVKWSTIQRIGIENGIYEENDTQQAVQFLHDLGTLQYFDNELLKDFVVIDPQWIVDVMACLVNVNESPIKDGYFENKDVRIVWKNYPSDLHDWLLRLSELFNLTFPLSEEPASLVPCLLPENEPSFDWPMLEAQDDVKEEKMIYKFTYLPTGLFNRAQVRLSQTSKIIVIWKNGSLLLKNGHRALFHQQDESRLLVKVQGPRPRNILFLIHEVLEDLIMESFQGVVDGFDFLICCPDCVSCGTNDPAMFEASFVQYAQNRNAAFIQCRKYFHPITINELQEVLPPSGASDFDLHLQQSVQALGKIKSKVSTDIFVSFCQKDLPSSVNPNAVDPKQVVKDIEEAGYSCLCLEKGDEIDHQDLNLALKSSKILLVFMSPAYEQDEECRKLFLYAVQSLAKTFIIVTVGANLSWKKTHTGMVIGSQELYIDMRRKEKYPEKITALKDLTHQKLAAFTDGKILPVCFISYCWSNSHDAAKRRGTGHVQNNKALGWSEGDPRTIKEFLESNGVTCWLDTEQIGSNLFEDICVGLSNAAVAVVCVSDEYARSKNCMMELRFAAVELGLPLLMAVVGTGGDWKKTEVGVLRMRSEAPKVSFQREDADAHEDLLRLVKERIPDDWEKRLSQQKVTIKTEDPVKLHNLAFREEYELAQRKFMRQISRYAATMDSAPYPRLVLIDFLTVGDRDTESRISEDVWEEDKEQRRIRPSSGRVRPISATSRKLKNMQRPLSGHSAKNEEEARGTKANSENLSARWQHRQLCLKVLCEHEQDWHFFGDEIPLTGLTSTKTEQYVKDSAPFLSRLYQLLKHSSITLSCFSGPSGDAFIRFIHEVGQNIENPVTIADAYCKLRQDAIHMDRDLSAAKVKRCHLPTGKISWLCADHSKGNHIFTLDSHGGGTASSTRAVINEADLALKDQVSRMTPKVKGQEDEDVTSKENNEQMEDPSSSKSERHKQLGRKMKMAAIIADKGATMNRADGSQACNII